MLNGFWDSMTAQSGVLATWIGSIATTGLVISIALTLRSMKISAQSSVFNLMFERFNAPSMLYARAVFAKTHLDRKENFGIKDTFLPSSGWLIIAFLDQIGKLVQDKKLGLDDVKLAYADYIAIIGHLWAKRMKGDEEQYKTRYTAFLDLHERIETSRASQLFKSELDAFFDEAFWECEAALDQSAKSEDHASLPPVA
ncbi:MAG TPA: hypothetical protein VE291_11960 [Terracidiphilus sp.]|jgi:hypothetical protein|nr:hypothetical protein [Terracidiphilus sp.]